uniref:Chromatin assembly factor 1 subunit A dimerization domain-containing protein n=2 Tax=Kalmanozyma brasiliensis (strain GHG001) TaxID=1365824 RepID=V5F0K6_KALBG
MLSDSDMNIDRNMAANSLKRKASNSTKPKSAHGNASSSDAENRPITASVSAKAKPPAKAEATPAKAAATTATSSSGPATKRAKLSSSSSSTGSSATPLVELKNGKLVLKQKAVNWTGTMPVLKAVITFQEFLDVQDKLDEIPAEHLHVIAKLTQESDKSLVELAKSIRSRLMPEAEFGSSDSEMSAASSSSRSKLTLPSIQAAINAVAERKNYGIDSSDVPSHSSASTSEEAPIVPAPLQLWRWEVTDLAMLPAEFLDKFTERRSDRESARIQAQQIFSSLKQEERQALLDKGVKSKISATVAADKSSATTNTPPKASKMKATAAGTSASQPISIDDDMDDGAVADTERDAAPLSTPVASHKRKSSSSASTPQPSAKRSGAAGEASTPSASSSPKDKRKVKEPVELSPEKQKEKEEKEAAKAERLRAKEAKRLEREAKEQEKQKAKEAKEAELKKVEDAKKRQANFLTSFVKKAAPKSPSKPAAGAAVASSSAAAGKAAETISDFDRTFLPCQYKDLAPINRFASPAGAPKVPQLGQADLSRDEMLSQFLTRSSVLKGSTASNVPRRRKGVHPPVSVREIKRVVTESDVLGGNAQEQAEKALETLQDRNKVQLKLLQFESDRRPGWYGTWTKSTNLIGPRCPLGQDPVSLDYSYDSDADWEEMGQVEGEDVQEGEEKEDDSVMDEDEDSEMDDWLVDDLEVEEEEEQRLAAMDVDDEIVEVDAKGLPVPPAPVTTNLLHPKKKKKVKLLGRRFDAKLVPFSSGPHWEAELGKCDYDLFSSYRIELLNDACFGLNPFTFSSVVEAVDAPVADDAVDTPTKIRKAPLPAGGVLAALWADANPSAPSSAPPTPPAKEGFKHQLREDAIPALLTAIDGSTKTRAGLVDDLKEVLDKLGKSASKNAIGERVGVYAKKEKKAGASWVVKDEWRGLMG